MRTYRIFTCPNNDNDISTAKIIIFLIPSMNGGYRDDESEWPAIIEKQVDAMIRLEKALGPYIAELKAG